MGKGKQWHEAENAQICNSWLALGQDAIVGTDQNGSTFWSKIWTHFNEKMMELQKSKNKILKLATAEATYVQRTQDAVEKQWSKISKATVIYCGCYTQAKLANDSGFNEEMLREKAEALYEDDVHEEFKFHNCWEVLKDSPKFTSFLQDAQAKAKAAQKRKKRKEPHPTLDLTGEENADPAAKDNDDDAKEGNGSTSKHSDTATIHEDRPVGNKKAKGEVSLQQLQLREVQAKEAMAQVQAEKNAQMEQFANDQLFLGLPNDDPMKLEYLELRKQAALESLRKQLQKRKKEDKDDISFGTF